MQDDVANFNHDRDAAGLAKSIEAARLRGQSMLPSSAVHGKGRICLMFFCNSDQKSLWHISGVQTAQIEVVDDSLRKSQGLSFLSSPRKLHSLVSVFLHGEKFSGIIQTRPDSQLTFCCRSSRSQLASPSSRAAVPRGAPSWRNLRRGPSPRLRTVCQRWRGLRQYTPAPRAETHS